MSEHPLRVPVGRAAIELGISARSLYLLIHEGVDLDAVRSRTGVLIDINLARSVLGLPVPSTDEQRRWLKNERTTELVRTVALIRGLYERRDQLIRQMTDEGSTAHEVGAIAGMDVEDVEQIIDPAA